MSWYLQSDYDVRFEWGLEGAERLGRDADVTIVVDVLSFSTCVAVAVAAGVEVFPYFFRDERAVEFANALGAVCAAPRRVKERVCLSPRTLLKLNTGDKLVLPSPNGATICRSLQDRVVLAGSLRNAAAVAQAAAKLGKTILVIGAGEKWQDGSLRPSLEDMLGAGAIVSELEGTVSPEAMACRHVFNGCRKDLYETISKSSSGQELLLMGFPEDNEMAAALNTSAAVPILRQQAFVRFTT
jgi:2-phosphosulfolactate phosphatase